ncbi:unnamed protein product, partial [Mesorhabditis spiculigera]
MPYFIGVDVGSASVRAGLFDENGAKFGQTSKEVTIFRPKPEHAEQSSNEIWHAVCSTITELLNNAKEVPRAEILGIGFDATCSLVILGENGAPLPATMDGPAHRNIIMWMDHRAKAQADLINSGNHDVLKYVGGRLSLEMQIPKLLWLRENNPATYRNAGYFMDLPDFLTYRATGRDIRSICSATCKWTYLAEENRWDPEFFGALDWHFLAKDFHVLPYHHGNRSPRANSSLKGALHGSTLENNVPQLAVQYLATCQAIALGHRHIIDTLNSAGYRIREIVVSGGLARNELYLQMIANATRCRVLLCREPDAMLLGGAIMATRQMTAISRAIDPAPHLAEYYARKFAVFLELRDDQLKYERIMRGSGI